MNPTGFHPRTSVLTDDMVEYEGFWLANSYGDPASEYEACRERAIAIDLSPLRKFEVIGPDAEALLQYCVTRNVRRLADGHVTYTAMCNEDGGMLGDGTLMRLGADNFRWVGGSDASGHRLAEQAKKLGLRAFVQSTTHRLHNLAVQGPQSREIIEQFVWTPPTQPSISELGWYRLTIGRVRAHNGTPLVVTRTGYSGELGFELWCTPLDAPQIWDEVFTAGEAAGISPLGLEALDTLRVEAGLVFAGYEFDETTDPFEAGIGHTVALDNNPEDFIGRAALVDRRANATRTLVGISLDGDEPATGSVTADDVQIGEVTSAVMSPRFGSIALARLSIDHAAMGTEVVAAGQSGTVVALPFFDPDKSRIKA